MTINISKRKQQEGAALAVGLILLLIITLMGYTGMKGTILQEKMAAGLKNRSMAYAGAQSALRAGEQFLYNLVETTNGVVIEGTAGGSLSNIYSMYNTPGSAASGLNSTVESFMQNDWSTSGTSPAHNYTASSYVGSSLSIQPEFMIQHIRGTNAGGAGSGNITVEFGNYGSGGGGGGGSSPQQSTFLITGKSRSGDGKSFAMLQSVYTAVPNSSPSQ